MVPPGVCPPSLQQAVNPPCPTAGISVDFHKAEVTGPLTIHRSDVNCTVSVFGKDEVGRTMREISPVGSKSLDFFKREIHLLLPCFMGKE